MNVPSTIGAVISSGRASLVELDTVLSVEDVYVLLEITAVDSYNRQLANKRD